MKNTCVIIFISVFITYSFLHLLSVGAVVLFCEIKVVSHCKSLLALVTIKIKPGVVALFKNMVNTVNI